MAFQTWHLTSKSLASYNDVWSNTKNLNIDHFRIETIIFFIVFHNLRLLDYVHRQGYFTLFFFFLFWKFCLVELVFGVNRGFLNRNLVERAVFGYSEFPPESRLSSSNVVLRVILTHSTIKVPSQNNLIKSSNASFND